MMIAVLAAWSLLATTAASSAAGDGGACDADAGAGCEAVHEYCIIGAGPGGLQVGHLMMGAEMDYRIFDGAAHAGAFFGANPVHRTLISLNKRFSGWVRPAAPAGCCTGLATEIARLKGAAEPGGRGMHARHPDQCSTFSTPGWTPGWNFPR